MRTAAFICMLIVHLGILNSEPLPVYRLVSYFENNNIDSLKIAIKSGTNINDTIDHNGNNALYYAAYYNNYEACKILLEAGCNLNIINIFDESPLYVALMNRQSNICQLFLNHNVVIDIKENNKIMQAACNDTLIDIFKEMCNKNMINPNMGLLGSGSLTHYAAWKKQTKILLYLHEKKVDMDYDDEDVGTPLQISTSDTNITAIEILLKCGCNPCYKGWYKKSAFEIMKSINVPKLKQVFDKYKIVKCPQ